jgi:hypothetical protein
MHESHAVVWALGEAAPNVGRLEIEAAGVRLVGSAGPEQVEYLVPAAAVTSLRVARGAADRVNGLRALVVETALGAPLRIAAIAGTGAILEIAQAIGRLVDSGSPTV